MSRKAVDIRDIKPSRVVLDFKLTIDGGTLGSSEEMNRIHTTLIRTFETTAHECGLGYSWGAQLACVMPKRMDARVERERLDIVMPEPKED